jgi:hypothetical protein
MAEFALMLPVLALLLGAAVDGGRAFYFVIASQNVAREAVHWATITSTNSADAGLPPTDTDIIQAVATPSQESFGLSLGLAPPDIVNAAVPIGITSASNPPAGDIPLASGQSWLFIYPGRSGRTALAPGQHWQLVASGARILGGDSPGVGDPGAPARAVAGGLAPLDVAAASPHCYTWTGLSLSASSFSVGPSTPYGPLTLTATVSGLSGSPSPKNNISFAVTQNPPSPAFSQTWTSTSGATGSQTPPTVQDTVTLTDNVPATAGTYTYTVSASSSGGGCTQPAVSQTFTIVVAASASPSPGPSPSPLPSLNPSPTTIASPSASARQPKGNQITCTVIYYFAPVTPLIIQKGFYIVGVATMQATY